jgi:hypothetical protein
MSGLIMYRLWLLLAVIFLYACHKDSQYQDAATIIGSDPRTGPCTGGTFILIDGHPNPHSSNGYFDIGDIPESFRIDSYPIKVKLDWKVSDKCFGNYVDISRIKRAYF